MFDLHFLKKLLRFVLSVLLGVCGTLIIIFWPVILDKYFVLGPGSVVSTFWEKISDEIATEYYFFNWTNSEYLYNSSVKPHFQELGPYKFSQSEEKDNLIYNKNGTVTYQEKKIWKYRSGNLDDVIIGVNYIPLAATAVTRFWKYSYRKLFFWVLKPLLGSIIAKHTPRELLFEGYYEPLIRIARAIPMFKKLGFPDWDRFGWFYKRNGTSDFAGVINMGTGVNSTLGKIYHWNYETKTDFFHQNCSDVSGFSGQFFNQNLDPEAVLTFSPEMRRKAGLHFMGTQTVNGLLGYKYGLGDEIFDNGTISEENSCFCNGECVPYGMVNLSTTRHGFPFFLSLPHFYKADPYYINLVDGLKPDKSKHESIIIVEPVTGIPIAMSGKIQFNLLMRSVKGIPSVENITEIFVPVLWIKQNLQITGAPLLFIKIIVKLPVICNLLGYVMIVTSIVLISLPFYNKYKKEFSKKKKKIILIEEQSIPLRKDEKTLLSNY